MLQDFCAPKEVAAAFAFEEANSDSVDTSDGLDLNLNLQLDDEHAIFKSRLFVWVYFRTLHPGCAYCPFLSSR